MMNDFSYPIILASGSPRRAELLRQASIDPVIFPVDIDETVQTGELPTAYIERMTSEKMQTAIQRLREEGLSNFLQTQSQSSNQLSKQILILTADTIGVLSNQLTDQLSSQAQLSSQTTVLTKPKDLADAMHMWRQMADNTHCVWTAVNLCRLNMDGDILERRQLLEKTDVTFLPITEADMQAYWQTGEPQDKAGGYAIQGRAGAWVSRIEGSYSNVVGLPLAQVIQAIKQMMAKS